MIRETITFKFENEDQQKRFRAHLDGTMRPGLTATYEQALRELRDYFREMAALRKRESEETKNSEYAFAKASEADAYQHAMDMTVAYLGNDQAAA